MATLRGALLGMLVGLGAALGAGGVAALVTMAAHRPITGAGPRERARALAEGISESLHWAAVGSLVLIPACALVFARRARRRSAGGADRVGVDG